MADDKIEMTEEQNELLKRNPHQFVEDQVERNPDSCAVAMGSEQISYHELNACSNRLAHFLRDQGVRAETLVGVCLDRSFDTVVSLLAILKSGGTYVPLDPTFPKERLQFILEDSELSILLTHSSQLNNLPKSCEQMLLLDEKAELLSKYPISNLPSICAPTHMAYVIYTSGSTGRPKGVMIPRSALVNFLLSMARIPGLTATDKLLAVTTTSFDISLLELLLPLVCGAQVVIARSEETHDATALQALLQRHDVTVMQATPTTWRMLLESGWEGKSDLRILCGGEALQPYLAEQLLPRCEQLWNMYGPTETTVWSSAARITSAEQISLGSPIANTEFHVLDGEGNPVDQGAPGELWIGGKGLAQGYLKRPELTTQKFVLKAPHGILYRTGDEVCYQADGSLQFLGRLDEQVKIRGFRIELGEIENALSKISGIVQAAVAAREDRVGDKKLAAYYTGPAELSASSIHAALSANLPEYMIPRVVMHLQKFPVTPNGKIDRKALPRPQGKRPSLLQEFIAAQTATEKQLAILWCDLLQLEEVGIDDSFFDLGGDSLAVVRMVSQSQERFGREIPPVKVFQYPTIAKLAKFLAESEGKPEFLTEIERRARHRRSDHSGQDEEANQVAIVGMVGRFPGANNLEQLWQNLCNSVESISFFSPEELGPGIDEQLRRDPDYIRARGLIENADLFDAAFFGINPLEAKVMDPQQRVFLELAHQALENAGYDAGRYSGRIGVFAGIGDNHYYTTNLLTHPDLLAMAGKLAVEYGNQKDYIALRTAYLLDLRGPAISLNTACSTTLLTVDQAYRSLLDYECDMALAGGVDITVPQKSGFLYQEGGTFTKDGHCRPFDAEATGTMFCDGAGVVVLKRLADAQADGDTVYAVIRGTGKNNNGGRPASFLAPSVDGQAEAIAMAHANAGVPVESIGYIEAHGTGTPVGDPIEFEALRKVFESKTSKKQFCYIGSIKGNIGHPTNAAGVAGIIKAALVLHREVIPPTLHFKKANPKIDFDSSPFMMSDKLIPFSRGEKVRRAAVSSFGFGGTNVHAILEEAPKRIEPTPSRPVQVILLSAKTPNALEVYSRSLSEHLAKSRPEDFADAAHTLQKGRKGMAQRRFVVAEDPRQAAEYLLNPNPLRCGNKRCDRRDPAVVFLFGGQGTQYVNMGRSLYRDEPLFRATVNDCCECLAPHLGTDLRSFLYPKNGDEAKARINLQDTFFTQPSIFVIEYALARLWQSVGIEPAMMAGHSIGEFVAATLAGVWRLEDALGVVALRGRLMQNLPRGSMMAVSSAADSVAKSLPSTLQIASNNSPGLCVVSGPETEIAGLQQQLEAQNIPCRRLHTSHAFHSAMMDPIVEPLRQAVSKIALHAPLKPFVSTVTGLPITGSQTTDPEYWARHSRATVQFSKAIQYLKEQSYDLFLECGPRSTLSSLTRQHFSPDRPCTAIPTLADTDEGHTEWATFLFALGSLWQNGLSIDWEAFYANEIRRHIPLPTYPFERQRFWVDPAPSQAVPRVPESTSVEVSREIIDTSQPTRQTATSVSPPESRKTRICSRVLDLMVPISKHERAQLSTSATFLEQGFDSLALTQMAFTIRKDFSIKLSFSQLMNQFPNVDMLVAHLDTTLPAEMFSESTLADTAVTAPPGVAVAPDMQIPPRRNTLEEVVAEQAQTISRLVALLEKSGAKGDNSRDSANPEWQLDSMSPAVSASVPKSTSVEVEATIPQRGIYASSRLSERLSASYNESVTLRLSGQISAEKIARAIEGLVERHDALRASFDETGRVMRVAASQKTPISLTDLSKIEDAARREHRLGELIADETLRPFSLPEGPLVRAQIILLERDRAAVIITAQHVICDGWSLDVLIQEFCALYSQSISGVPALLPPASSYAQYARNVTQRSGTNEFEQAGSYWRSKFANGFPVLELPADHIRSPKRELRACRIDHLVPTPIVQSLRATAAKQNCSVFTALLGSLAILLGRIARKSRFVIALPVAEQPVIGQPELVGHCVNLVPFLVDLRENETVGLFLKMLQSELVSAQEHSVFTMVNLLEDLHPIAPAPGISSISIGLTNTKKFKPSELPQHGFTVQYDSNPKAYESFEVYVNAVEEDDNLLLRCHYDVSLFDTPTIEKWLTAFDSIMGDVASDAEQSVLDLADASRWNSSAATLENPAQNVLRRAPDTSLRTISEPKAELSPHLPEFGSTPAKPVLVEALIPLWQRILGSNGIGPDDDFFAVGGHSIAAAQLVALIERDLGVVVPLATIFEASTPRKMSCVLSREGCGKGEESLSESLQRDAPTGPRTISAPESLDNIRNPRGQAIQSVVPCAAGQQQSPIASATLERSQEAASLSNHRTNTCVDHSGVRPFVENDIAQVANLWWRFLHHRRGSPPEALHDYFHELYFEPHPVIDNSTPSLVYEGKDRRPMGFLGIVSRTMSMRGRPIKAAFGGNFVVHPEARSSPAGVHLLMSYMAGDQDLSITDSASPGSRLLLERLGFSPLSHLSINWMRPLRPSHYAVDAMSLATGRLLAQGVKWAAKPFCMVADGIAARLPHGPFRITEPSLQSIEPDVETLFQCLDGHRNGYSLWPQYDESSLQWLLSFMERMHPHSSLRKIILRDSLNKVLGWYLYYLKPGGIGQVVQIGGDRKFTGDVLDHLFHDAWKNGATGLQGVISSDWLSDFGTKNCIFTCRRDWTLAWTKNSEVMKLLNSGRALMSRLDGEWCLSFES